MYTIDDIKKLQAEVKLLSNTYPEKAIPLCEKIRKMSEESGYEYGIAFAQFYYYEVQKETLNVESLIEQLTKLVPIFRDGGFYEFEIRTYVLLGVLYDNKGDLFATLDSYLKVVDKAETYDFPYFRVITSCNVGCILVRLNDPQSALRQFEEALKLLENFEKTPRITYSILLVNTNLCLCHLALGNMELALKYADYVLSSKDASDFLSAGSKIVKAFALINEGNLPAAHDLAKNVAEFLISSHSLYDTMDTFYALVDLLTRLKEYDVLERYFAASFEHVRSKKFRTLERDILEAYIKYLRNIGADRQLEIEYKRYFKLNSELASSDNEAISRGLHLRLSLMEADRMHRDTLEQNRMLKQFSQTDPLTHLPNRYKYDSSVPYYFQLAQKEGKNFCYMLIDVDCFKQYNDTYGHLLGDSCLWHIASIFRTEMANDVMFFRYGGDEYAAIYYDKSDEFIEASAGRINDSLAALKLEHKTSKRDHYVTISIGYVNRCPGPNDKMLSFVNEADTRLYKQKAAWKNIFNR